MADHHSTPTHPHARREHRCIWCGGPILVGEKYVQQTGIFDGARYRNRYHAECYEDCGESCRECGDWEFSPYQADYPARVKTIVDARRAASTAPNAPVTGAGTASG